MTTISSRRQGYAKRVTVIIDPSGNWVLKYAPTRNLYKHAQLVLDDLAGLTAK